MTAKAYQARLALLASATTWQDTNPFRERAMARLESPGLAALGGLHAPPRTEDDRHFMAGEDSVVLMRELPAAVTEPATEF